MSTFEQCPLKFKFNYIDKIETEFENSIEAFMGSMVHETLEKLYKDLKFEKLNELKELIEFYNDSWNKNWTEGIIIVRKEYSVENYKKMGEKFITDYYNHYKPFDSGKTIGLETRIVVKIGDYTIQGFIDRLDALPDGVYEIHDYKTSNSLPTQEYIDKDRQLALYSLAVKQMYKDCKKVVLVWHYLAFDKELRSERSDSELDEMKKEVMELISEIESTKEFPAKQSALCDWCAFQGMCPNFKHLFELQEKDENEYKNDSGLKLVNEYAKLKKEEDEISAKLEKVKEALAEFAEKDGVNNIYGSEFIAFVKKYPRLSFPKKNDLDRKDFEDTVRKVGLWDKLASVDVYELAKMINSGLLHDEIVNVLDRFVTKGSTTYVRLRNKK
jgi:putative RecB family exonuclease